MPALVTCRILTEAESGNFVILDTSLNTKQKYSVHYE